MLFKEKNIREEKEEDIKTQSAWTAEGYIQNQDLLEGYIYRTIPAKENSCGPIAVYNLCKHMGRELQFEDLLQEMDGMHLLHMPGPTLMHVMRRCLTKYLPGWQEVHGRKESIARAQQSSMGIFRYHEQRIPHFVGYYREEGENFHFYNVCDEQEDTVMPMAVFTRDHLRGGSVKLFWWD